MVQPVHSGGELLPTVLGPETENRMIFVCSRFLRCSPRMIVFPKKIILVFAQLSIFVWNISRVNPLVPKEKINFITVDMTVTNSPRFRNVNESLDFLNRVVGNIEMGLIENVLTLPVK